LSSKIGRLLLNSPDLQVGEHPLRRVLVPLAKPGIAVAALFAWLESWNEFTYALYLSLTENTLPLQVYYYVTRGNWFDAATYATLLTVPVMVVTACLQRYLKAGYLTGAVKG
jgi:trehalose transport system permease protein